MGGFLYTARAEGENLAALDASRRNALVVFERNQLRTKTVIEHERFALQVFDKRFCSTENVLLLPRDDFVVATGTLIYKGMVGEAALRGLYDAHPWDESVFSDLRGHFCILLRKQGVLHVCNDAHGLYHVYLGPGARVISNSFLAVMKTLSSRTVSEQELYEYICYGAMYGDRTMLDGIEMLDCQRVHQIDPAGIALLKRLRVPGLDVEHGLERLAEQVAHQLIDYFELLKGCFGNDMSTALSGGFDSRLMVALLRRIGVRPQIYVYGDVGSRDVRLSRAMAEGEGFALDHTDKVALDTIDPDTFRDAVSERYYFHDGRGITGVLSGRSDVLTRVRNAERSRLLLNGGGGEIYRNFWLLPDRRFSIEQFIRSRYDFLDPAMFTERFDQRRHLAVMKDKIRRTLQTEQERLSRDQIEMIYPLLRLKYWMGQNNTCNNSLAHALTPFAEPCFAGPSSHIPIRYKNAGRLEAAVIRLVDAKLARYPSSHGFNFYDPIPLKETTTAWLKTQIPVALRPILRRRKAHSGKNTNFPVCLGQDYLRRILDPARLEISRYVKLAHIRNRDMLNRALTAELLLGDAL